MSAWRLLRSVAAIVVGIAVFSLVLLGATALGNALLVTQPPWFNRSAATRAVWLMCNIVGMVAAGAVVGVTAPRVPAAHAIVMGAVQSLFTIGAVLTLDDRSTPAWLWLAGIVTTIPAAWSGAGLLRAMAIARRGAER